MKLIKTGTRDVRFYLDMASFSQYGLNFETFEKRKLFTAKIVDDLLNFANKKYGLSFDESDIPKAVYVVRIMCN